MLYLNSWNDLSDLSEDYFVDLYTKIINDKNIKIYSSFFFWQNYMEALVKNKLLKTINLTFYYSVDILYSVFVILVNLFKLKLANKN